MIFYFIHMICEAHRVMFDLFFWYCRRHTKCAQQCKTLLFCAMYDPQHKPIQPSAFSEKRNSGSLTVAQAVEEASAPGVTSFEDFIRSREANKTHDEAQHVSKTRHSLVRRWLDKKPIGQHTDKLVHYKSGESLVRPCLRSATAVVRSGAFSRVSEPQRTVVNVGGGHIKLD
jgi:hypothetical protein